MPPDRIGIIPHGDHLVGVTCYSTEPGDDPVAQLRAGAYENTGPVALQGSLADTLAQIPSTPGLILVDPRTGGVYGSAITTPDLFCLAGYPEASHSPGDVVLTIGDRRAATAILGRLAMPWHGDHLRLPARRDRGLLAVFLAGLHHIGEHNLAATLDGRALIGWRDLFPSVRIATSS